MERIDKLNKIASVLCGVDDLTSECPHLDRAMCNYSGSCNLTVKTDEQLDYILSPINECIYLEACAGSGKTEVLGIKAAYEICKWNSYNTGIAVLTFINEATSTISDRISKFYCRPIPSNHFVGTFSSFIHGNIAQRFGYKEFRGQFTGKDKSFQIVESDTDQYSNNWLQHYKLNFPIFNHGELYANQIYYLYRENDWLFQKNGERIYLRDQYDKKETQEYITSLRRKYHNPKMFDRKYLIKQTNACKKKFWESGFASFEDMTFIALKCLDDKAISKYMSTKYPLIMVDECQDLSNDELEILSLLIEAGSKVHCIGDLNQSIYSFKDASPNHFNDFAQKHGFKVMPLSDNFRSTQSIVNVSRKIGNIQNQISGIAESRFDGNDCFYFEYDNEIDAISIFRQLLNEKEIARQDSVILVRTQNAKEKLVSSSSIDYCKHAIINSIQLWKHGTPQSKMHALQLLGWQLQNWFGFHGRASDYYYSDRICPDAITWRLMLRDILDDFLQSSSIDSVDNVTYSEWYKKNKKHIVEVINRHSTSIINKTLDSDAKFIRVPRNTASSIINKIIFDKEDTTRVETDHSVKGNTFDAVLLLSSANANGKTGYWQNWLKPGDEASRICYVACTRPRSLLCWGVHRLEHSQRQIIENLGFVKYNANINHDGQV